MPQTPRVAFTSPPFFSSFWVGRDPVNDQPRLVHCFGPSEPNDFAPMHAGVLGLESLLLQRQPPALERVWADLDHHSLSLCVRGYDEQDCEVLRTDPLPDPLLNVLRWRPEMLLLFVDVPLRQPQAQLASIGLNHLWTGVAPVRLPTG